MQQQITTASRRDSLYKLDRRTRKEQILAVMSVDKPMTAREVAHKLGFHDLNAVKPRLTELCKEDKVAAVTRKYDQTTGVKVSAYIKL